MIIIDHTPDNKIAKAKSFVDECVKGERGFCFGEVKRYPLDTGRELRQEIVRLKRERMDAGTLPRRAERITERLAEYRQTEHEHYTYDESAYKILRSNYDRLKRYLHILCREGEIESFILRPNGWLGIKWWTERETILIEEVQQGMPSTYEHVPFESPHPLQSDMNTIPIGYPLDSVVKQGMLHKEWEPQVNKGSGEYDPEVLKQRDADNEMHQVQTDAKYITNNYVKYYGTWQKED